MAAETALTITEQQRLDQCEAVIATGLKTFVAVGMALFTIRDGRLYRHTHGSFEDYCQERWNIEYRYANYLIGAAQVVNNLGTMVPILPTSERQARPLIMLGPAQQIEAWQQVIDTAPDGKITAAHVQQIVRQIQHGEKVMRPLPVGTFRVLYADPPWQYDNSGFDQSAAEHYPTMPTEDICAMPVGSMAADESVLFLWVTNPFLEDGLKVLKAWGFEYKTNLVWVKDKGPTIGWFVQGRHELLLIGTKGSGVHPKERPLSVIRGEVTIHSRKPNDAYDMIEAMYDGPYVELFSRRRYSDAWEVWGNEPA